MKIKINHVVHFHYTLKNKDGDRLDATPEDAPLPYLHGSKTLMEGLESSFVNKQAGDAFTVTIPPDEAFGEYQDILVIELSRHQFDAVDYDNEFDKIKIGSTIEVDIDTDFGPQLVSGMVLEITDDMVVVDLNHPLAGETLIFDIRVVSVRAATDEEINTGQIQILNDEF
jgi:FKBP-type peptidyl-prolyl cis-trans isomerase SlyD